MMLNGTNISLCGWQRNYYFSSIKSKLHCSDMYIFYKDKGKLGDGKLPTQHSRCGGPLIHIFEHIYIEIAYTNNTIENY